MDKREEMAAWAKSLKPGDKVIYKDRNDLSVFEVARVTPTGRVRTTNHRTFALHRWLSEVSAYGTGVGEIVPFTDELFQIVQKQEAERAEKKREMENLP